MPGWIDKDCRTNAVLLLLSLSAWAGPGQRAWQDARVTAVDHWSVPREGEIRDAHGTGAPYERMPATYRTVSEYRFATNDSDYAAQWDGKPFKGLVRGDRVRIAVQGSALYVRTTGGKQRKLKLVRAE